MEEIPDHLLMRSAQARAKARGVPVEQVLAEWKGEASLPAETSQEAPQEEAAPAVEAAPPGSAESAEETERVEPAEAPTHEDTEPEPVPAAASTGPPRTATAVAPEREQQAQGWPEGVRSHRLLTVVRSRAIQQVKAEPIDRVSVWPHLVAAEFTALLAITAFLTVLSVILQAPLLELANSNLTPNPSKAPWYFLGLQELLSYFDPQIAGVLIPGLGLLALMVIPFMDRNPSTRPADRKFAIMLFTYFIVASAVLTTIGVLFRGPGFNFTYPWADGIWFDDLLEWFKGLEWFQEQHHG